MNKTKIFLSALLTSAALFSPCHANPITDENTPPTQGRVRFNNDSSASELRLDFTSSSFLSDIRRALWSTDIQSIFVDNLPQTYSPQPATFHPTFRAGEVFLDYSDHNLINLVCSSIKDPSVQKINVYNTPRICTDRPENIWRDTPRILQILNALLDCTRKDHAFYLLENPVIVESEQTPEL